MTAPLKHTKHRRDAAAANLTDRTIFSDFSYTGVP